MVDLVRQLFQINRLFLLFRAFLFYYFDYTVKKFLIMENLKVDFNDFDWSKSYFIALKQN